VRIDISKLLCLNVNIQQRQKSMPQNNNRPPQLITPQAALDHIRHETNYDAWADQGQQSGNLAHQAYSADDPGQTREARTPDDAAQYPPALLEEARRRGYEMGPDALTQANAPENFNQDGGYEGPMVTHDDVGMFDATRTIPAIRPGQPRDQR
jgi:hypothetical protein